MIMEQNKTKDAVRDIARNILGFKNTKDVIPDIYLIFL